MDLLPRVADAGTQVTCVFDKGLANGAAKELNIQAVGMRAIGSAVDAVFGVTAQQADGTPIPDIVAANDTQTIGVQFSASSDVSITKTAVIDSGPGQVVFTLTPRLRGGDPLDGTPITVTDTYNPVELAWVSTTPNAWNCQPPAANGANMQIVCTLPEYLGENYSDMPPITIRMTPLGGAPNATNTASVSLVGRGDPVPSNNTSVVVVDDGHADVTARKQSSFSPAVLNQPFQYQLVAHNNGPWGVPTGQVINLDDTLPDGMTLNAAPTPNGWTCGVTNNGGVVGVYPVTSATGDPVIIHCERSDGLPASNNSAAVVLQVQTATPGNYHNEVCATLGAGVARDPNDANNCSSFYPGDGQVTTTTERADLQIVKNAPTPDPVNAGELLTYTLDITNAGPDTATNITVTDALGPLVYTGGLDDVQITAQPASGPGSCTVDNRANPTFPMDGTGRTVRCNFPQMAPTETATIEIVVRPNTALTGSHTNSATIYSSAVGDPDRTNNSDSASSQIIGIFDMEVSTWASTATAADVNTAPAGSLVSFTSKVESLGPSSVPNAKLTIQLPANATYQSLPSVGGASCDDSNAGPPTRQIVCTWNGQIPAGAVRDVTYTVLMPNDTSQTVTSASHVELNTPVAPGETSLTNNDASKAITLSPPSTDLQVDIQDAPDPVNLGGTTTYTVRVLNAGPSSATNAALNVTFGPDTAVFSYQGTLTVDQGGTCIPPPSPGMTSGTITCTWPTLPPNQTATVTFKMRGESLNAGAQTGSSRVNVSVSADETDPQLANNTDSANTTISRIPPPGITTDLSVDKTATVTEIFQGRPFNYTLTVTNNGPVPVTPELGAQVVDVLPATVALTMVPTGCNYESASRALTCRIDNLAVGAPYPITIPVTASTPLTSNIVNTARTDVPTDPNPGNNSDTVTVKAVRIDLQMEKAASQPIVVDGDTFTYTLTVTNNGPGDYDATMAAEITDTLPAGLTYISDSGGCAYAAPTLTCPISAPLASGQQYAVTVTVQVQPSYGEKPITNTATVVFPADTNPGNNSGTVTVNALSEPIPLLPAPWLVLLTIMAAATARFGIRRQKSDNS